MSLPGMVPHNAATAAAELRSTGGGNKKSNSFFKLKGLERMASGEDVVDVQAKEPAVESVDHFRNLVLRSIDLKQGPRRD